MDDVGERSEPQDEGPPPVAEGGDGEPPGGPNEEASRHTASDFPLVAAGLVALVVLVGLIGWLIGRGDGPGEPVAGPGATTESTVTESSLVEESVATAAPTSVAPTVTSSVAPTIAITTTPVTTTPTTPVPTTAAATTVPSATTAPGGVVATTVPGIPPTTTVPGPVPSIPGEDPIDDVVDIVPNLAAFPNYINIATELEALVAELVAAPRHDVSSLTPVATLCAAVQLEAPLRVSGRWELDGRPLASEEAADLSPPGFGYCMNNEGDPMASGAYQFIAVDAEGDESAAGTFVAGAARVDQRFLNNGGEPVCAILLSPATADYFEAFPFAIPVGGEVTIPIADVPQDVRTLGCADTETPPLAEFRFDPSPDEARDLIG